jgi:cation diffusion facilitator family transporter
MLISTVANGVLTKIVMDVGKKTASVALVTDAWHHWTDVWTSLGVMGGLGLIWAGEEIFRGIHFHWIDPLAAITVAILIIRAAYILTLESGRDLMDVRLPKEEEDLIRGNIERFRPHVYGYHHLLTRKSGSTRFVEFHLLVDPKMSVAESHRITDEISRTIGQHLGGSNVNIHIEPCDGRCSSACSSDCRMSAEEREALRREMKRGKTSEEMP